MKKLLWIGDFSSDPTRFRNEYERITHEIVSKGRLESFDCRILGRGYLGDGHEFDVTAYPAGAEEDLSGANRVEYFIRKDSIDVVFLSCPFYLIPRYVAAVGGRAKVYAWVPVGGYNVRSDFLSGLDGAVFYTDFGLEQAIDGGFDKPYTVIPYGIDLCTFRPFGKSSCREQLAIDKDVFMVGCVDRNSPRSRMEVAMSCMSNVIEKRDDIVFAMYGPPRSGFRCLDLSQLSSYFGIGSRNGIIFQSEQRSSDRKLGMVYSSLDLQISTTLGEDWGSTQMMGMACGVPQLAPAWSSLKEWSGSAAKLIPCTEIEVLTGNTNMVGGVVDRKLLTDAIMELVDDDMELEEMSCRGFDLVREERFRWHDIASRLDEFLTGVLDA